MQSHNLLSLVAIVLLTLACNQDLNPFDNEREFEVGVGTETAAQMEIQVDRTQPFVITNQDAIVWDDYECVQDEHDPDEGECTIFARNLATGAVASCRCNVDLWEENSFLVTESSSGRLSIRRERH